MELLVRRRATREERLRYGRMAIEARGLCWKLRRGMVLTLADEEVLASLPDEVREVVLEVGNKRRVACR